jgi:hypothetical protein
MGALTRLADRRRRLETDAVDLGVPRVDVHGAIYLAERLASSFPREEASA